MVTIKRCKDCAAEQIAASRPAPHPGPRCSTHHKARRTQLREIERGKRWLALYGITADEYWKLYEAQGGVCYLCRRANGKTRALAVDHDHVTGQVRGLLDKYCNRNVLGRARDEIAYFERCIEYLTNPPAVAVIGVRITPDVAALTIHGDGDALV